MQPPPRFGRLRPLQLVRVHSADHLDDDRPPRSLAIPGPASALAPWTRAARNLQRMDARMVADHLRQAAMLTWQAPSPDVLLFAATGTAELLDVLRLGGDHCGASLPDELLAAAEQLRGWAATLKPAATPPTPLTRTHPSTWDAWQ